MPKKDQQLQLDARDLRSEMIAEGTRWLLEMEMLDNQHMKNVLMANVYKVSSHIRDVEILIDTPNRKMLVYLGLGTFGRLFKKRELSSAVLDMLSEVLPTFQFRVIFDPELFLKALRGLQKSLVMPTEVPKAAPPDPSSPSLTTPDLAVSTQGEAEVSPQKAEESGEKS